MIDHAERRAAGQRQQAVSLNGLRVFHPEQLQDRWHHVDDADVVGDDAGWHAGTRDDERDASVGVIDEESVLFLTVLAFNIIGDRIARRFDIREGVL